MDDAQNRDLSPIARAAALVREGAVGAYPTDTFYGLACDPRDAKAVARLFAVKGRDARVPSPLIGASMEQLSAAVEFSELARRLAAAFWPGPLSLILPARPVICRAVLGGRTSAAVRVPAEPTSCALADAFGFCITATSANLSGEPPVTRAQDLSVALVKQLAFVLDGGQTPGHAPSTIVDLTTDDPRLVRPGAVPWNKVLESLR
jgi:L-threonylcarbamoyladenylate synthase